MAIAKGCSAPIIDFYKSVQDGSINKEELLQMIDEILFANLDVTMGGISWVFVFLAAYPESQAEVRDEVMKHDPLKHGKICWEKYISKSSTLLAASITESFRLKPLAAFSVPQAVPSDRNAGGYLLPRGMNCIVDTYSINTNNAFWGDDSTTYRPSRFLERSPTSLRYNF